MGFDQMTSMLGGIGAIIAGSAYVPQIVHLIRERCSAGISRSAFALWLVSTALVALHAIPIHDAVFIGLGLVQIASIAVILFYSTRYRGLACPTHAVQPSKSFDDRPG